MKSVNCRFELRDRQTTGLTSIRLRFYHKGERFLYSLGNDVRVYPDLWDDDLEKPISNNTKDIEKKKAYKKLITQYEKHDPKIKSSLLKIDKRISNVKSEVEKYFGSIEQQSKRCDFNELKAQLQERFSPISGNQKGAYPRNEFLVDYVDRFIQEITSGKRKTINQTNYSLGSVKILKGFAVQLKAFQGKNKRLRFEDVTMDFYDEYIRFFHKKNYSQNTVGRHIKNLKTIMQNSFEEGLHSNTTYRNKKFRALEVASPAIALTQKELDDLYALDLTKESHLELVRDVFLVGCYTALRYCDYSRIKPHHIKIKNDNKTLVIITQKTSTPVYIPINPVAYEILDKYDFELPHTHEQKVNKRIKRICELANITNETEIERIRGGRKIILTTPKYNLVKTHTARRTGATLMYNAGIPTLDIMKITGHTTEKNLLKYIKVTKEEAAERMRSNPFFTGQKMKVA